MILYYLVIFGFFMAMSYYFVVYLYAIPAKQTGFPGEVQLNFLEESAKAQGKLFFVEQAAKESAQDSALSLARRGGFSGSADILECGFHVQYNFWNKGEKWCKPNYKENFVNLLNKEFSELTKNLTTYEINYDYFVKDTTIVGVADETLYHNIYGPKSGDLVTGLIGSYEFRPSFNIDVDYNVEEYEKLFNQAQELVTACRGKNDSCIAEKFKKFNVMVINGIEFPMPFGWKQGVCDGPAFNLGENKKLFCFEGGFLKNFNGEEFVWKQIKYQFALDFTLEKTTV